MPGMRHRVSGRDCPCCTQWAPTRASEKHDWQQREWAQTDPHEYWSGAACEPAYYLADDSSWVEFGGWWAAYLDGELPIGMES